MVMNDSNAYDEDDGIISRTAQKKAMQIYSKMGEELLLLNASQLSTIPLNHEIIDALSVAKKIKVGNALKRQLSFIGKLIRTNNHEEIQTALDQLKQQDTLHEHISQQAEKWRDRFLDEEPNAIAEFIDLHPHCDKQKTNQLIRSAIKEAKSNQQKEHLKEKESKHKKALFKLIRTTISP
jgi:ribosome-associated protein